MSFLDEIVNAYECYKESCSKQALKTKLVDLVYVLDWDWIKNNILTQIKNQGGCGACPSQFLNGPLKITCRLFDTNLRFQNYDINYTDFDREMLDILSTIGFSTTCSLKLNVPIDKFNLHCCNGVIYIAF